MDNVPKAYLIADMSKEEGAEDNYTITQSHISLNGPEERRLSDEWTKADGLCETLATTMKVDPIAFEHYASIHQAPPKNGLFTSMHYMLFSGENDQAFHFHPSGKYDGKVMHRSSERFVLLYPLWHKERESGGVTFEWFGTENNKLINNLDDHDTTPVIEADSKSPQYTVDLKPGQIAMVNLQAGAHRFKGEGFAISFHPVDIYKSGGTDALIDNTAGYRGGRPEKSMSVEIDKSFAIDSVQGDIWKIFNAHSRVIRSLVESHDPHLDFGVLDKERLLESLHNSSRFEV